jgi:hypothetical protein
LALNIQSNLRVKADSTKEHDLWSWDSSMDITDYLLNSNKLTNIHTQTMQLNFWPLSFTINW